jgi:hypothetical protein
VVELIADDGVLLPEENLEDTTVGVEARRVKDGRLRPEEVGDLALERRVLGLGAADEAHRRHPEAPLVERLLRRVDDAGVVGQAEVVVGAEVERVRLERRDMRRLRRRQLPLVLVEAGVFDLLQGRCELVLDGSVHRCPSPVGRLTDVSVCR